MPAEIDTLIVGGGQAGLAASEHLSRRGIAHIVLERARIAESWRSMRWDSLVMNGPAWHDRFPSLAFDCPPDAFPGKDEVARYMERYAQKIAAPIHCGIDVQRAAPVPGHNHFQVDTSQGQILARSVIA
ncbi:MAG: FAD-dependent oxidoreductase, partial [Rhodobacteraceae bacterium]|nr:FAD-dependent oxidoreductase [Paracoccaceae bacterium]